MRPLQALGGVQGRERHHVLLVAALGQADDDRDGLRHVEHAEAFALDAEATVVLDLTATALGNPVDEIEHVAPARGGEFLAVFTIEQMLFVADVLQPTEQQRLCVLGAGGVAGPVFQVVHIAAELVQ